MNQMQWYPTEYRSDSHGLKLISFGNDLFHPQFSALDCNNCRYWFLDMEQITLIFVASGLPILRKALDLFVSF